MIHMRFCTITLGCKVNQFETQAMESMLIARGGTLVKPGDGCDICLVNTCAVTSESERKSRQAVRRAKKLEPGALIAVGGCLSQREPSAIKRLGADLVGGTGDRQKFAIEIGKLARGSSPESIIDDPAQRDTFEELQPYIQSSHDPALRPVRQRTRALLKIQDGCGNYCAYCIVPYVRGGIRSLPLERAATHALRLQESGFREIVVTGIEISSYGKDLDGGVTLIDVVREICAAAPLARIRLGSLDPGVLKKKFCRELSMIPNLCPHFHLSLQSGCDGTLRRMRRKYDTGAVREAIALLRSLFPDCGITADLIAGFPGETDAEFTQTLEFIKSAAFSDMHIFPFSPRPGTLAAGMPEQVEKSVRRERAGIAAAVAEGMAREFRLGQIGKTVGVLFERKRGGYWTGHSGNYIEISARDGGARNCVFDVRITDVNGRTVWGEIVKGQLTIDS